MVRASCLERLNWKELARWPEAELARLDIAAVNLACAEGLPGAERIKLGLCLQTLDAWTTAVRRYTELSYDQFFLTNPAKYDHSEPLFRMVCLALALQRHCGVRYDPSKIGLGPEAPFDFDEEFIHGVIQGPGGTCATLPVVYAAIGRRLGYPVKLVCTKQHLFCRWDDPLTGESLNIEGSGDGVDSFPDDHYRKWPVPLKNAEEEKAFGYLKSLTPRQELAHFIGQRAFRLADARQYKESLETFILASELDSGYARYLWCILAAMGEWKKHLQSQYPPRFPRRIDVLLRRDRRRWPSVPWEVEREIASLHATEWCLHFPVHVERWWEPLRRGHCPHDVPASMEVNYEALAPLTTEDEPRSPPESAVSSGQILEGLSPVTSICIGMWGITPQVKSILPA